MDWSGRPDAQGNFAVTGIGYATSLFGEARQREIPLGIHGQAGLSGQIHSFYKSGFGLCSVPGTRLGSGDAELSHI